MITGEPGREVRLTQEPEDIDVGEDFESLTHDPAESLRIGLSKLYLNYLLEISRLHQDNLINDKRADELIARIDELSARDIGYEISKEVTLELAKEIMGPNMCFGPDEVRKAGIEIREEVPPIPFNIEELERAKELGQMLIYRTSTTMKELDDTISPTLAFESGEKLLYEIECYEDENFFRVEKIRPGWALVSKELTPESTDKDYLEQSELLAEYLVNEVFKGKPLPEKYQAAVDQINDQKKAIRLIMDTDDDHAHLKVGRMLAKLNINQLFRQSPVEVVYDLLVYFQNTGERLRLNDNVRTSRFTYGQPYGQPIDVGSPMGYLGISVIWYSLDDSNSETGVSFCRRGADFKS